MKQDNEQLLRRLRKPTGPVDVVLDTDTYNEIDDQFALSFLIRSHNKLNLKAIYAAPFFNKKSSSPGDGMEKSYNEIGNILTLMDRDDLKGIVKRGSEKYLPSEIEPVDSSAARELVELSKNYTEDKPLYVIAIGAITNVASALLLKPEIKNRIVVVWLGGHAHHWPDTREFNLFQDVAAARVVFSCGVALVQLPCMGVVSGFTTSKPELEYWLQGKNRLCDYLLKATVQEAQEGNDISCWTRAIWDVTAVAWLVEGDFVSDCLVHSPIPEYDGRYSFNKTRHFIRYVYHINRDKLFETLFRSLACNE